MNSPYDKLELVLIDKLPYKELKTFRDDAGWQSATLPKTPTPGKVQWATVIAAGRRIAIARLELAPPEFCYVSDFIVLAKYRKHGVGSWFLQQVEQHCLKQGIKRLVLEPANGTRPFYTSRHFTDDPYLPAYMKKEISPLLRRSFSPRS
jgi:GNAT superfamily N-acetyltransferase